MSLFTIFFSFQSFIFLIGINFFGKRLSAYFKLNKNFNLSIFSTLILLISFCFYFLNSLNFFYLKEYSEFIFYFFILLGYFSLIFKFLNLKKRDKKELFHWNYLDIIYFLIIINILISSLVPVTDADSVRYHLGQFNNDPKFIEISINELLFSQPNRIISIMNLLDLDICDESLFARILEEKRSKQESVTIMNDIVAGKLTNSDDHAVASIINNTKEKK